ncbi:hypothetical protein X943_001306 [Babesia divergens]|uniref:Uncharacterized protein n=1 Tax=Babesia divergens TaxID=32595 RepID=A0AAD9G6Q8_BABDI|nr:hypothetical protein X943_001306 [Babesia divergens]
MKSDGSSSSKKRASRRFPFDPQDVSSKFHLLEDRIRSIIVKDRAFQKGEYESDRDSRRLLFKRLREARDSFVPPESKDEADIRALSINSQIVIKKTMLSALRSLLSTIETAKDSIADPGTCFTTNCLTSEEEQAAERQALEALRELRSSAFHADLIERSRADREARQQRLEDIIRMRNIRMEEEEIEENDTLLASDRKLLTSGIYRCSNKQ